MKPFLAIRPHLVPCVIAAALVLVAIGDHPYAYYQLMRVAAFAAAAVALWVAAQRRSTAWLYTFLILCVLFNPIVPMHLGKAVWRWVDAASGIAFLAGAVMLHRESEESPDTK